MAVPVAPQPAQQAAPAVNLTVNFANGSAELTPDAIRTLDALGRALASKDLASYRFRIEGHTDTVGSRDYNRALSERRAEAVVDYVAKKYGVDPQPAAGGRHGRGWPAGADPAADAGAAQSPRAGDQPRRLNTRGAGGRA